MAIRDWGSEGTSVKIGKVVLQEHGETGSVEVGWMPPNELD